MLSTLLRHAEIQIIGSEFNVNNIKAWIHPAMCNKLRLVI